jgi:amino acid permease
VGLVGTIFNLMNTMLGAGILGGPGTMGGPGLILSIIIAIIVVAINHAATVYTLLLQDSTGAAGFEQIAESILGRYGVWALAAGNIVFNGCALLGYLILGTDFLISWFALGGLDWDTRWKRAPVVLIYGLLLPIALSIPKSLKFLSYISMAEAVSLGFFVLATLIDFGRKDGVVADSAVMARGSEGIISAIAVFAFAFALPTCICPVVCDYLVDVQGKIRACLISLMITLVITIFPSIFSYLQFGDTAESNVINSYPDDDGLFIAVRVCFFIIVTASFPSTVPSVAGSVGQLIYGINQPIDLMGSQRWIVLALTMGIPLIIAMFLGDVQPALEVGGAIGACLGNFVLPCVMWVVHSTDPKSHWTNILAIVIIVFGTASGIAATYYAVLSAIDAFSKD